MEFKVILPILDTRITHHDDGSLPNTEFQKTHRDYYVNFESHHPLVHKAAVAHILLTRVVRICTDVSYKEENFAWVLNRQLIAKNRQHTGYLPQPHKHDKPEATAIFLYIQHLSKTIFHPVIENLLASAKNNDHYSRMGAFLQIIRTSFHELFFSWWSLLVSRRHSLPHCLDIQARTLAETTTHKQKPFDVKELFLTSFSQANYSTNYRCIAIQFVCDLRLKTYT